MQTKNAFIHLRVHSAYSLAEGAIRVKDLVKLCCKKGMAAVAVTDTGNLFGAMEFAIEASSGGVQPIIGCQVALEGEGQIVLLVQNEAGYRNLCRIVSDSFLKSDPAAQPHTDWKHLEEMGEGLICLSGGLGGPVGQALSHNQDEKAEETILRLKSIFGGNLYLELQRHGLAQEDAIEGRAVDLAYRHDIPLAATNDCYFSDRDMHEAHDALLCIAEGRYITEENRRRVTPEHYFKSAGEMERLFADLPEAISNTAVIAQRCHFLLAPVKPVLPAFKTEDGRSETDEIRLQAEEGLEWRLENFVYPQDAAANRDEMARPYRERLAYELDVITKMEFSGYFLVVSDFIKWAKGQGIPVGPGRGSGAGSVVAWSLKITDLDPLKFGLLFERMLNPERVSMPDFDVDFCQERRDEVIRYVQERYGYDRVAQIITFGKLQARAVVRDVGRVLQMPYGQVDRIAKMIPNNPAAPVTLEEALVQDADLRAEKDKDDTSRKLIDIALQLEGLYRHASTHAAGVVIGNRPLQEMLPLYRDPRSDMPVTQFNMKYVEQAGLVKFDFLGLKTMTVIQKTVDMIAQTKGETLDILKVPFDDMKSYQMMTEGRTVGVFQLESSGMRSTLTGMKPNRFEDIIALVSLYRPGPMDNIPRYNRIKEGSEEPDYMHPKLKPYLEETYGIMIYQEQVMQAAQALAGYTLGGADLLRRAMGKKIKEEMDAQRDAFIRGAAEHSQVPARQAEHIFDQINKFAGYGFNKSHAAAYALIAYWTGWLKANYPLEFMAASMTLDLGNTDKLSIFKQDLSRMDIRLLTPDINKSGAFFTVEGDAVRYALAALKGVGGQAMQHIIAERDRNGPYKSLADFIERLDPKAMNKRQFEQMICAGVFDSLHPDRAQLLEAAETLLRHAQALTEEKNSGQVNLFGGSGEAKALPPMPQAQAWDPLEKLRREFDAVGFYLSAHPLDARKAQLERLQFSTFAEAEQAMEYKSSSRFQMAGVLIKKQEKVSAKSGNKFAYLQLSDSSGVYEVMIYAEVLARSRDILEPGATLSIAVEATQNEDQIRLNGQMIQQLDAVLDRKTQEVRIRVDRAAPMRRLSDLLKVEGQGGAKVLVMVDIGNGRTADVQLAGRWKFSAAARNAMHREAGVLEVQEY